MQISDIFGEVHEVYRGQTVRWADPKKEYAGMLTGVVMRIDDRSVSVLSTEGTYYNVHPANLTASIDGRSQELILKERDIARKEADEYAVGFEAKHIIVTEDGNSVIKTRSTNSGRTMDVMKFIETSEYRARKTDIMAGVADLTDSDYIQAIRNLLSTNRIKQYGKRRGTSYGLPGREYGERPIIEKPRPEKITKQAVDISHIVGHLRGNSKLFSRAELKAVFNFGEAEWTEIAKALKNSPDVIITGKKRGTRYQGA